MKNNIFAAVFITAFWGVALLAGCAPTQPPAQDQIPNQTKLPQQIETPAPEKKIATRHHFAQYNDDYRFSAELPKAWQIAYIPGIESINIYDPALAATSPLEQSQIFIRKFSANIFLTLNTVTILERENAEVHGHAAVRYEIEKKPGVSHFPQQPSWRNERHKLIDIRHTKKNPSTFYVIAYNPALDAPIFEEFIDSFIFDNDRASLHMPIEDQAAVSAASRITKKPFGIFIESATSPVQPERFRGFHTGIDFETLPGETQVPFFAYCGGPLKIKQTATGYGGVIVQECNIEEEVFTALYGHVDLTSIDHTIGDYIASGTKLGVLGDGFTDEAGGERQHLHFALHRGSQVELRGYVDSEKELGRWIHPGDL